jgi:hypothetical protein
MSIYITGDTHGTIDWEKLNTGNFPEQKCMTPESDYVIILGDFGGVWDGSDEDRYVIKTYSERNFTTLFIDGNHENHDMLDKYPVEEWHGGKVHKIRPHVIHLMRGQAYDICGKKFFVFGGARSHDIRDGILESDDPRVKVWKYDYDKLFRVNHVSWWAQEMPSDEDKRVADATLAELDYKVDFVISHDMSSECLKIYSALFKHTMLKPDELNNYLDSIRRKLDYTEWFCGHYHDNRQLTSKDILLYEQLVRVV